MKCSVQHLVHHHCPNDCAFNTVRSTKQDPRKQQKQVCEIQLDSQQLLVIKLSKGEDFKESLFACMFDQFYFNIKISSLLTKIDFVFLRFQM